MIRSSTKRLFIEKRQKLFIISLKTVDYKAQNIAALHLFCETIFLDYGLVLIFDHAAYRTILYEPIISELQIIYYDNTSIIKSDSWKQNYISLGLGLIVVLIMQKVAQNLKLIVGLIYFRPI